MAFSEIYNRKKLKMKKKNKSKFFDACRSNFEEEFALHQMLDMSVMLPCVYKCFAVEFTVRHNVYWHWRMSMHGEIMQINMALSKNNELILSSIRIRKKNICSLNTGMDAGNLPCSSCLSSAAQLWCATRYQTYTHKYQLSYLCWDMGDIVNLCPFWTLLG